jgi:hypothetical protein
VVNPEAVRAAEDLQISWTPFTTGRADPNGIADDLIFVMLEDCRGKRIYHSGRPLETPNPLVEPGKHSASWLTYTATEITVPVRSDSCMVTDWKWNLPGAGYRPAPGSDWHVTFATTTHPTYKLLVT